MDKLILLAIISNLLIIIFFNKISKFVNVFDYPSERKIHSTPTPILGGLIIFVNLIIFFIYEILFNFSLKSILFLENMKMVSLFIFTSCVIFFLGFLDDKINISPHLRLIILIIILTNFLYFDNSSLIQNFKFSFYDGLIGLKKASFIFTLLCFLVFMISLNMFDGTNLQSSIFYLYISSFLLVHNYEINLFLIYLIVPLIFFSIKNFNGKVFLGDGGTYLLAFIFSYLIIHNHTLLEVKSDEIALLILFPVVDALRLCFFRILDNKSPFYPDKDHFHHILINKFNQKWSILLIFLSYISPLVIFKVTNNTFISLIIFLSLYSFIFSKLKNNKNQTK